MFSYDPLNDGLEFLSKRDLENAEIMFLRIMNDPYAYQGELSLARKYLNDIRDCQSGVAKLKFSGYKKTRKKTSGSHDDINEILVEIYFSSALEYSEIDEVLKKNLSAVVSRLRQIRVRNIVDRDELYNQIDKKGALAIKKKFECKKPKGGTVFDVYRWKTIFRKFVGQVNPFLLDRHLELLDHIIKTGEMPENIGL